MMGWPCQVIGEPVALPPAQTVSIAALIDLDEFRFNAEKRQPELLEWYSTTDGTSATQPNPESSLDRLLTESHWKAA